MLLRDPQRGSCKPGEYLGPCIKGWDFDRASAGAGGATGQVPDFVGWWQWNLHQCRIVHLLLINKKKSNKFYNVFYFYMLRRQVFSYLCDRYRFYYINCNSWKFHQIPETDRPEFTSRWKMANGSIIRPWERLNLFLILVLNYKTWDDCGWYWVTSNIKIWFLFYFVQV